MRGLVRSGMAVCAMAVLAVSGCSDAMKTQRYEEPLEPSEFFVDGVVPRPPVAHTVSREEGRWDPAALTGLRNGQPVAVSPLAPSLEQARRGREQFEVYCSVCHGSYGYGRGPVVERGFPPPPSLHEERLREVADGHLFRVITDGLGLMYPYRSRISVEDRWAIVTYIRSLQLAVGGEQPDEGEEGAP